MAFEVGKEFRHGEMLQARGVVGHHVGLASDVGDFVAVAVVALVEAGRPTQVGRRGVGRHGPLSTAGHRWRVVGEAGEGDLAEVVDGRGHVRPCEECRLF